MATLALATVACGARTRRTPDDTLVVLIPNVIRDLDPRFAITNWDMKLSRLVAPGLTSIDEPTLEPRLELAESVERIDDVTWDVVLREDARFADGRPVTAADVVFTYESTMAEATGSLYAKGMSERFEKVEAVGERRARFHLKHPLATLMSDLDFGIVPARSEAEGVRFPGGGVIGAGPYRVVRVDDEDALLERNPHYFGPRPQSERLHVRTVRDANARTLMLVGGSADFTQNTLRLDLVDDVSERPRLEADSGPSAILTYMMMHNEDPVLSDVRVRRAIAHALDRERIVEAKFGGRAVLATGLLPPSHWAYHGQVERYPHDPDKARALLDEAGYPDPDGPGGQPRLRLTYKTSADQFRLAIARILARQLAEVGIEVEVRAFEFGTFFADIKKGNYQLASMQTADITEPDFYYAYFHSSRIPSKKDPDTGNRWRYRSARVDELTERGRQVIDREQRIAIYAEVQEILAGELPIVPLWHEDSVVVRNVDVTGYVMYPSGRLAGLASTAKSAGDDDGD